MNLQRFLDPHVLAQVSKLDLVAKTVVDGFVGGLHRSPDFGFSQEFAEYRAYTPGDDLRHVDWSVYARSERLYLKRYRGETNSQLSVLLDASNSMSFSSGKVSKIDYARFAAASLFYLANHQRDAAGLVVFDDEVRNYIQPSTRQGQFHRLLHGIEHAEPRQRTDFAKPFLHLMEFLRRRGMVVVFSDFYADPETIIKAVEPLRFRGNDVILFHVMDRRELDPRISDPVILIDMETQDSLEVSPDYANREYRGKVSAHIEALREKAKGAGMDYYLMVTDKPLDGALREYLHIRLGRL
jgi:uncharacterized protein (DUF58 family)